MPNIAVIGAGAISWYRFFPEIENHPDCRLVAVCDKDPKKVQKAVEKYPAAYGTSDLDALLCNPEVDAVVVATPNFTHAGIAVQALLAGKHVLVEKPMATTLQDAARMLEAARCSGSLLMVDQNERLMPVHRKAMEILRAGRIGKVLHFHAIYAHSGPDNWSPDAKWFFSKLQGSSGVLGDLGVHKVDILRCLVGSEVKRVSGMTGILEKNSEVNDNAVMLLEFENGAIGTLHTSWTLKGPQISGELISCEHGRIEIGLRPDCALVVVYEDGSEDRFDCPQLEQEQWDPVKGSGVVEAFVNSIQSGTAAIPAEDVIRSVSAVFAGLESAEKQQFVDMREFNERNGVAAK